MLPSRTQLENSVISHAPKDAIGPLFVDIVRGPILPPRGTKERDWQLRIWDQADFNGMWQGARSGLVKKIAHIPFEIKGPPEKVQYYQDLLGYAHFSQGYEYLVEMWGRDYLTQSYGGIFEIAGAGDPSQQLVDTPTGINHLDAGRCYVTGNPTYPILYYSLWDGKLHKMHASRVYQIVDDPIPDERYFGLGTSALERAISINQREVRMNQYVDTRLDDMPQPGLLSLSGASRSQWDAWVVQYQRDTGNDKLGPFGRTIVVTSVDPNAGVKAESIPFAQTPEKFDLVAYKSLDVDEICLAIGIDRQEIWELAGRGLGSSNQSQVMAEKAKGKTTGTMISSLERFMNWAVLPDDCEFEIKAKDNAEQTNNAAINLQYAQTAQALTAAGFTKEEVAKVMIEGSQTYKDAFTDDKGNLTLTSEDPGVPPQLPVLAPASQPIAKPADGNITGQGATPLAEPAQQGSPAPRLVGKGLETDEQRRWFFANLDEVNTRNETRGVFESARHSAAASSEYTRGNPAFQGGKQLPKIPKKNELDDLIKSHTGIGTTNRYTGRTNGTTAAELHRARLAAASHVGHAVGVHQAFGRSVAGAPSHIDIHNAVRRVASEHLKQLSTKAFSITRIDFEAKFANLLSRAVKGGARPNQIENLMLGLLQSSGVKAFSDGLREGGVNDAPDDSDLQEIQNIIADSIDYLDPLLQAAFDGTLTPSDVQSRAAMWGSKTLRQFLDAGRISADRNAMYEWFLGPTQEHCDGSHGGVPCIRLAGQVHRFKDWYNRDLLPGSSRLDCKGFNCGCRLMRTSNPAQGRF